VRGFDIYSPPRHTESSAHPCIKVRGLYISLSNPCAFHTKRIPRAVRTNVRGLDIYSPPRHTASPLHKCEGFRYLFTPLRGPKM
jgi:hypothetical protein